MASQDTLHLDVVSACKAYIFYNDEDVEMSDGVRHDPSNGLAHTNQRPSPASVHFKLASEDIRGCLYDVRRASEMRSFMEKMERGNPHETWLP